MQMTVFSMEDIQKITNGIIIEKYDSIISNFCTDTRQIRPGDFFIPLIGDNFNGHQFIKTAFEKGASGTFTQRGQFFERVLGKTIIEVGNTLKAYQDIAVYIRRKINPFVIGITGSSGKTSTKELSFAFLSKFFETFKSEANFNNQVGVPQNLLKLEEKHKVAIIEMGMRGKNQIKELAEIAEPNAGIITGIGSAHIELLGSKEEIANAKWELAEYLLKTDGYLIIPAYDRYLEKMAKDFPPEKIIRINLEDDKVSDLYLLETWFENEKQFFSFKDRTSNIKSTVSLSVPGKHQISNALLVLALSKILGIKYPSFIDLSFEHLSGRSEEITLGSAKIINDSYNANPESMKAAIETFISIPSVFPKILVLGEMRELGNHSYSSHFETGQFCSELNFEKLIVIGENAKGIKEGFDSNTNDPGKAVFVQNNKDAGEYLKQFLNQETKIFLKASRGARLEEVIDFLRNSNF